MSSRFSVVGDIQPRAVINQEEDKKTMCSRFSVVGNI